MQSALCSMRNTQDNILLPTKFANIEQSNSLSVCYGSDASSFVPIWFKPVFTTYNLFQTRSTVFFSNTSLAPSLQMFFRLRTLGMKPITDKYD
jgi:hypothetical protein